MKLTKSPYILYSDGEGNVYEDTSLYAAGRSGYYVDPVPVEDWMELPEGGNLYELPNRIGIGIDVDTGEIRECDKGWAVAAFVPPAYTGLYLAAYQNDESAEPLPLFCYTTVGYLDGKYMVPAIRIEQDIRQESAGFNDAIVDTGIAELRTRYPHNRIVEHLANHCALTYHCPAARNYFMGRWECPVPTSPACNSNCIGCISMQPQEEPVPSPQFRLDFKPTAGEIVEYTVPHLAQAPYPIISFGQGCEGEPLLMWETIREAIVQIRNFTPNGSININTNGSKPAAVEALCKVGLNSIRVSTNSLQPDLYRAYYRPNNYAFEDILESIRIVNAYGGWTSINYFVFPGVTDTEEEYEALRTAIKETGLKMIQWRNFNIDPDWYLQRVGLTAPGDPFGIKELMRAIQEEFPSLKYGYYNPPSERFRGNYETDFAH